MITTGPRPQYGDFGCTAPSWALDTQKVGTYMKPSLWWLNKIFLPQISGTFSVLAAASLT